MHKENWKSISKGDLMIVNMLTAISKMLAPAEESTLKVRTSCAKTMLDEVINGLKKKPYDLIVEDDVKEEKPQKPKPEPIPKGKFKVVVGANRRITSIEGLPLDGKIELDGKVMTHKEAIGKTFTSAKIL